jgi:hypothetical protein
VISHEATQEIWNETYMSALLRAILYSDDYKYRLTGFRRFDPIPTLSSEQRFLEAVEHLYQKGKSNICRWTILDDMFRLAAWYGCRYSNCYQYTEPYDNWST